MEQLTVGLYTLGCKVSQYETEAIAEDFERQGFLRRDFREVCDVYVINTCTVTAEADRKSRQCIRRALARNPHAYVMVVGCYAQTTPTDIAAIEGVSYVAGTYGKMRLAEIAAAALSERAACPAPLVEVTDVDAAPFEAMCIAHSPRTRAYVKIEDGCECRCTYCAIPGARGRVRSKAPADAIREVEQLAARGVREVVLTGIETASYGIDLDGYRLIDLLEDIDRRLPQLRVRLGSLTPELFTPSFVTRLARLGCIVPHFHISMQSGCDRVLAAMKRRYNTTQALAALARLREAMPQVQFTTDLMVGFPGESEEMFLETLDFARRARFLAMHVFSYSRRRGTPADTYDGQVDESVKAERSRRLMACGHETRDEILDDIVREAPVLRLLLEAKTGDTWTSHSDEFIETHIVCDGVQGDLVSARPVSHRDGILTAVLADNGK